MTAAEEYGLAMPSDECARAEVDVVALVETHSALLFRVAYSVLRSASDAEDVVQDVFLKVLERPKALAEIREMRVWLVRIAWNRALDRRRRIRPEQMDERFARELAGASVPADQALAEAGRIEAVLGEIARLPKGEREVLLLAATEELSSAEMGKVLGRSESATRALLFRARTRLKERMRTGGHG